ncbi:hypothetical protein M011DRAFT_478272 [Sporormia fimetaria CBS 119925]|uniref:BTB domain-containing protein n=1 Tax=Sporormia fimetaria CBS 119925 TaxID=1340428 RepID=A0A6A6V9A8_9PLEO|nr:hypothetical protein M011DRAFT_478272 [Sporormia fimetaria CBS 119925]
MNSRFSDFRIALDEDDDGQGSFRREIYFAHSEFLSELSEGFEALFGSGIDNQNTDYWNVWRRSWVEPRFFKEFLRFFYTVNWNHLNELPLETALEVYSLAVDYECQFLDDLVTLFFNKILQEEAQAPIALPIGTGECVDLLWRIKYLVEIYYARCKTPGTRLGQEIANAVRNFDCGLKHPGFYHASLGVNRLAELKSKYPVFAQDLQGFAYPPMVFRPARPH